MGIDMEELVMALEEEFGMEITDAASQFETVGEIYDYVISQLHVISRQRAGKSLIDSDTELEVWERLQMIVVEQLAVTPEEVTKSAHIVNDLGAE